MTNGEKIKATFPHYDIEIDELKRYVRIFYENFYTTYSWDWWNAEYKEPTTKIEESNFSQEQYLADIQSAYDCGKSVIDKIRAEIVDLGQRTMNDNRASGIWACRDIIDKYKAESEG